MRHHLRFLFKNRQVLRLKVNAAEDLLLNGAREPTHRGQCLHLLDKVDLACVTSALTRLPDAKSRSGLLAGVVRFSTDPGVLLLYLESLLDAGARSTAALAFGVAVRRIDFASLSLSRMRRVLELIASTFEGHERVQVLFGLLQNASFRTAFDGATEALPEQLSGVFVPLAAVHEVVVEGQPNRHGLDTLAQGVTMLLDAPAEVLQSHPEAIRERLLEHGLRLVRAPRVADRAEDALLLSLPRDSRTFSRLGLLRAAELMRRHEDERAAKLLSAIREAHPGFNMPGRWLAALEAPRIGRFAWLGWDARDRGGEAPEQGRRLRRAFWLDAQRAVWLRVGRPEDAEAVAREVALQRACAIAGVVPLAAHGRTEEGAPWVALPPLGRPADLLLPRWRPSRAQAMAAALAGAQALLGLALAGVELPDADPARLLVEDGPVPHVLVADLAGATRGARDEAARLAAHDTLARTWLAAVLQAVRPEEISPEARASLAAADSLPSLVQALAAEV